MNGYRILDAGKLKFDADSSKHNGVYSCEAENGAGTTKSGLSYLLNILPEG